MIRGTTPTFTFTIRSQDVDLTAANNVYVSFVQGGRSIEKTGDDLDVTSNTVKVWLTQDESLKLAESQNADVQINWTYLDLDGETIKRAATVVKSIPISRQLLRRVIS